MLVLGRKEEQTIQIGDDVQITILRINGNSVKVGIQAPDQVRILRGELTPAVGQWEFQEDSCVQQATLALATTR